MKTINRIYSWVTVSVILIAIIECSSLFQNSKAFSYSGENFSEQFSKEDISAEFASDYHSVL